MTDPFAFALAVLALLGTPGPTNTLLATAGAAAGWRRSLRLLGAELAGYLIAILALHLALGDAVRASAGLQLGLRWAAGAYLVFTAVRLWMRPPVAGARGPVGFGQVFVTTLLNPKAMVFAFIVVPFGAPAAWAYLAGLAGTILVAGAAWIAAGAALGRSVAGRSPRLVPRVSAVVLCAFAAGLVAGG